MHQNENCKFKLKFPRNDAKILYGRTFLSVGRLIGCEYATCTCLSYVYIPYYGI